MSAETDAPTEEDLRVDDEEFNPAVEPKKAKAWLNLLQESEDAFEKYNFHCDNIDKQYASLERLTQLNRDKEFQMFWANAEVIKPSIYANPPVPVVVPKFMDRRPVYQAAAETLERCATVCFDLAGMDELMKLVRDDLALIDRGIAWCRYESGKGNGGYDHEKVCIDFKNRRDFLHSISRNWREVTWVAAASYLTRGEARKRFRKTSGDEYQDAEYKVDKDTKAVGGADNRERAKFWEIWDKASRRVLWVAHGCEKILDEDDPHLDLREYFPCPRPAYGTVQRGSLVPVPDVLQYKDQLDEINLLTGRIHALSDALEAKGFYPAGGSELADAVQAAISIKTPGRVLVPISNWAAFGGSNDVIIWLPIDMIAQTITGLVALRKQVIDDIYQIMGLSDIMRGSTNPQETLGAQELKTEYGSTRVRDKQQELVRFARDLVELCAEIMTEKFSTVTMIEMSQTQLPTQAMLKRQVNDIVQKVTQAASSPQGRQMMQQQPDQAQAIMQQAQSQIDKLEKQPTVEQVFKFLKDNRAKSFVLDIETDSTIQADDTKDKQGRAEFVGMLAQLLPQLSQMITMEPKTANFCGEILKFATAPFRAGRSLEGAIDDLVATMQEKADAPKGDDPATAQNKTALQIETMKVQQQDKTDQGKLQLEAQKLQLQDKHKQMELQNQRVIEQAKLQAGAQDDEAKANLTNQKAMADREKHQADLLQKEKTMELAEQKGQLAVQAGQQKQQDMAARQQERSAMQQAKQDQLRQQRGIV